jgi:hypothetical protein
MWYCPCCVSFIISDLTGTYSSTARCPRPSQQADYSGDEDADEQQVKEDTLPFGTFVSTARLATVLSLSSGGLPAVSAPCILYLCAALCVDYRLPYRIASSSQIQFIPLMQTEASRFAAEVKFATKMRLGYQFFALLASIVASGSLAVPDVSARIESSLFEGVGCKR